MALHGKTTITTTISGEPDDLEIVLHELRKLVGVNLRQIQFRIECEIEEEITSTLHQLDHALAQRSDGVDAEYSIKSKYDAERRSAPPGKTPMERAVDDVERAAARGN